MRRRLPLFSGRLCHLLLLNPTNPLRPIPVFPILHPPHSSSRSFSSSTLSREDGVSLCCQMWIDNFRHPYSNHQGRRRSAVGNPTKNTNNLLYETLRNWKTSGRTNEIRAPLTVRILMKKKLD
ncbi:hypothetical protein DEO72_LG9g817 [Vigna unguiculata]|uniref:Uncharacterized protein n=1 Tax=Vigna unguiculata TaxID=3917 RepID=A0A4D6MYV3_VIGUN|nr:hypothetical protein DEO72_LG9g817 [Vigna unguiculata]